MCSSWCWSSERPTLLVLCKLVFGPLWLGSCRKLRWILAAEPPSFGRIFLEPAKASNRTTLGQTRPVPNKRPPNHFWSEGAVKFVFVPRAIFLSRWYSVASNKPSGSVPFVAGESKRRSRLGMHFHIGNMLVLPKYIAGSVTILLKSGRICSRDSRSLSLLQRKAAKVFTDEPRNSIACQAASKSLCTAASRSPAVVGLVACCGFWGAQA